MEGIYLWQQGSAEIMDNWKVAFKWKVRWVLVKENWEVAESWDLKKTHSRIRSFERIYARYNKLHIGRVNIGWTRLWIEDLGMERLIINWRINWNYMIND